jgi:hypothetical protein
MGFATHLGPWLLGTVKETTGTTAGTIRNLGATIVSQTATVTMSGNALTSSPVAQSLFTLPAGAKILSFQIEKLATISGNSVSAVNTTIGNSGTANAYMTTIDIGLTTAQTAPTTIAAALVSSATNNIGTVDIPVFATFTAATGNPTAGSVVITCQYLVRGSDGVMFPTSA